MVNDGFQKSLNEIFYEHTSGDKQVTEFCENCLSLLIEDKVLLSHCKKVAYYSVMIFSVIMTRYGLTDLDRKNLFLAALLHDIGKLKIPPEILNKAEALTPEEFSKIKNHSIYSLEVLNEYHFLRPLMPIIRYHHERFDGKGYPDGLHGNKIPLLSRIISVADSFDAITSFRPYKKALSVNYAVQELMEKSGTQFDPTIAESMSALCRMNRINIGWEF